ncbi:RIP metalloprotease RseP [Gemella sp. GH3]|uniref:RIP metalloprotease RseP n=1 Tax=unclassified Gemella TaxID=2624949 RepID=UPI0015CFFD0A|nr:MULTISPECIES: RIP metalloprotease RseP [unclassified Gemella]MBF0713930.1 RIP metalloprotease RseP [Gemella sp. GH3.1]NYS50882.1 RIP metalloprotease RseP [Gemella sp. GH3]
MQGIIVFIIVFFVVVTVHELGHFIAAKRSGILCQEFAIGFGPKIFHKKIGETNFTIRLLPIGGYVKMPDNVFDFNNDVSPYDIKKGMQISLKLDNNDQVEKIILDKSNDIDLLQIEVNEYDLTYNLFIEGFTNSGQDLEKFTVRKDACVVFSGMEEQIAPVERMFSSHSWGKKFITLFAGPFMNFVLALFIFIGLTFVNGYSIKDPIIGEVVENSPAQKAGIQVDDKIKEIDGVTISNWSDISSNILKSNGNQINVKIERLGREENLQLTPEVNVVKTEKGEEQKTYKVGIAAKKEYGFIKSIIAGFNETLLYSTVIFKGIVGLFASIFSGGFSLNQLGGPVAIYELSTVAAQSGILTTIRWIGILSVNLGLMNLIPIPVLDGGRIIFVLYEAIFRKPISKKAQYYMTATFSILLLILLLAVTWNDISRLFSK